MGSRGFMSDLSLHILLLIAPRSGIYAPMVVGETEIDDISGEKGERGRPERMVNGYQRGPEVPILDWA